MYLYSLSLPSYNIHLYTDIDGNIGEIKDYTPNSTRKGVYGQFSGTSITKWWPNPKWKKIPEVVKVVKEVLLRAKEGLGSRIKYEYEYNVSPEEVQNIHQR